MYQYEATILKVVDGDTINVRLDLGMSVSFDTALRIAHINAPEKNTIEGVTAMREAIALMPVGSIVIVNTIKDRKEKYGRYLATVTLSDGTDFGDTMLIKGLATLYEGGKR